MAQALMITRKDLVTFTSANGSLDPDKFLFFIKNAQIIQIQNYLGTDLYNSIQNMIKNNTLTPVDNPNYYALTENYIKDCLIYWAFVEFLPFAGVNITNSGIFSQQPENAVALDKDRVDFLIQKTRSTAEYFTNRLVDYLCDNANTLFPEYYTNTGSDINPDTSLAAFSGWVLN
tara:strand:+ start:1628 stop:2149 length:522 start_codon:yes stop_codon:yes gene_type:complete